MQMNAELLAKCGCCHCGNHIEFPIEAANQSISCPHCGEPTELTLLAPRVDTSARPSAAELMAAFGGPIPRTRVSIFYHMGLLLVAFMMLILPMVYLGLIVAASWGVYKYATGFAFLLRPSGGGIYVYLVKLLAYTAPLFAGGILVLFMIKPLFARPARQAQPLAMNPALEPTLYAFISKICDLVGAPMPKRVDLVCELNAAASFRRGFGSLFSNDLVLTIGLPLVAGLNLQQMANVIAHEFGHFTQGFGMRLSYVIRRINNWFARLVYERDSWDVWLEEMAMEGEDWRILLIANCARLAVGLTRLVLKFLMFLAHGVSCFLLRQMEHDADSYAIKVAGSAAVESTIRRVCELGEALGKTYKDMRTTWNLSRRLPEDFPSFLLFQHSKLNPAVCEQIQNTLGLAQTGVFDSHPCDAERIRRARQAGDSGVFPLDLPASVLFSHFEVVSKQVTQLHYAEDLGIPFDQSNLRPVEMLEKSPAP